MVAGGDGAGIREEPRDWNGTDKFTVVLETTGLNATELNASYRERGLDPEQVERWRQASQDANEQQVRNLKVHRELEKALAEASDLPIAAK